MVANGCLDMRVSNAAVVGEEHVRSARRKVKESQHKFSILIHAARRHRNHLDAVFGKELDRLLQTFDDIVFVVRRRIENEERNACTCRLVPRKFLQRGFKRGVYGFGVIATVICILLGDVFLDFRHVFREIVMTGEEHVSYVTVKYGRRAQRHFAFRTGVIDDVAEIGFEEIDFVFHRACRIDDERDVGLGFGASWFLEGDGYS